MTCPYCDGKGEAGEGLRLAMNGVKAALPVLYMLLDNEYNVDSWGLHERIAALEAARDFNALSGGGSRADQLGTERSEVLRELPPNGAKETPRSGGEREIWTCPSCGWRQDADRPRICGRYGEPCPGPQGSES